MFMMAGLNLAVNKLNPEELANSFDDLNLCGESTLPENLRKLRIRIIRALEEAKANATLSNSGDVP